MPRDSGRARVVLTAEEKAFVRGVKRSESALRGLERRNQQLERQVARTNRGLGRSVQALRGFAVAAGATVGLGALTNGLRSVVTQAADFEAAMLRVSAAGGATGRSLEALTRTAEQLGASTEFSAVQAAMGLELLQRAGLGVEESIAAIPKTLDLASAAGIGLAEATGIAATALSALGLGTESLGPLLDTLAKAAASANTTVPQLGEAFGAAGAIAVEAGVGMQEMVAALTLLQARGRQGTQAGTDLRGVILALLAPSGEAADTLERLGVRTRDTEGNFRGLTEVMRDLNAAAPDPADLNRIFGLLKVTPAAILSNLSRDVLPDLTQSLMNSTGALQQMVDTMRQGLAFELKVLESSASAAAIAIGNRLAPAATRAVQGLSGLLQAIAAFASEASALERSAAAMELFSSSARVAVEATRRGPVSMRIWAESLALIGDNLGFLQAPLKVASGGLAAFQERLDSFRPTAADALERIAESARKAAEAGSGAAGSIEPIAQFTTEGLPPLSSGLDAVASAAVRVAEGMAAAARATGLVRTQADLQRDAARETERQLRATGDALIALFPEVPQRADQLLRRPIAEALAGLAPQVDAAEASARLASRELSAARQFAVDIGTDITGGFARAVEGAREMNVVLRGVLSTAIRIGETLLTNFLSGRGFLGGLIPRQFGGPVSRNRPYLVGERGPEVVVPRTAGQVLPNNALGGVTVNFAPVVNATDAGVAELIDSRMANVWGPQIQSLVEQARQRGVRRPGPRRR